MRERIDLLSQKILSTKFGIGDFRGGFFFFFAIDVDCEDFNESEDEEDEEDEEEDEDDEEERVWVRFLDGMRSMSAVCFSNSSSIALIV